MRILQYISLIILLVGCHRATDKLVVSPILPDITSDISMLRDRVVGVGGVVIRDNIVVGGRVVSADSEGNFYGSIVVEDEGGAIEVMLGMSYLESLYPVGLYVALRVQGCYADYTRGVLQVGTKQPQYEYYSVGNLASKEECDRVVVRSSDVIDIEPTDITIAECREKMCGRLVRVRGVRLVDSSSIDTLAGDSMDRAVWGGYSLFKDSKGDSIALYTSDYARYANSLIPQDSVVLVGILQRDKYRGGEECYYLKMRYEKDCTIYHP